ncbi:unnamed protein product [Closterium sp. Yama58-4]|nr:unnamed protein product [Closterium sp. Yama58-4]
MPLCVPQPAAPPLSVRMPLAYGPRAAAEERAGGETAKGEEGAENASAGVGGGGGGIDLKRWMEQRVRATGIEPFPSLHGVFPPPSRAHSPDSPPEYHDSGWIREPPRSREGREGKEGREVNKGKGGKEGKEGRQANGAKEARDAPARPQVAKRAGRGASSKFARLSHAEWEAQAMAMVAQKKRLLLAARSRDERARDERGGAGKEREKKDRERREGAAGGGKEAGGGVAGRASGAGGAREREGGARHVQLLPPPRLSARPAGEDGGESAVEGGRAESSAAGGASAAHAPRVPTPLTPHRLAPTASAAPLSPARPLGVTDPPSRREAVRRARQAALVACLLEEGFRLPHLLRFASTRCASLTTSPTLARERMAYLRAIGLPATDVPRLVARCPKLLTYRVDTRMAPRVDFLLALGVPVDRVARVVQLAPGIFECSVDRALRPRIRFLQNALQLRLRRGRGEGGGAQPAGAHSERAGRPRTAPALLPAPPRAAPTLPRFHGRAVSAIPSMLVRHPQLLHYSLDDAVRPRVAFLRAIGLSSRDVAHVLFRLPQILSLSVPNCLAPKYDYLIRHLGGSPNSIVSFPAYFSLSLHTRIRPRHLFYLRCRAASAPTAAPPQLLSPLSPPPAHDPPASPRAATSSSPATPSSLSALPLPTDTSLMPPPPAPHPAQPAHPFAFLSSARPFSGPSSPTPPPQAPLPSTAFPLSLLAPTDEAFCKRLGLPNDLEFQAFKLALASSAAPPPQSSQGLLVHASAALPSAAAQPAAGVLRTGKGGPVTRLTSPAGGESTRESTVQGS